MTGIQKGTICMVVNDCRVNDLGEIKNIKGHLIYNQGVFDIGFWIMDTNGNGFTRVYCEPKDLLPIDPDNLISSLNFAYRKTKILGRLRPFLTIPEDSLKREYNDYVTDFNEYHRSNNIF